MRYPPVNACIYCGTKSGTLTEEHILARALGGNLILPAASCQSCSKITGEDIENPCLRWMLIAPRTHWNLPSRHPKRRPKSLPIGIGNPGTGDFRWDDVPVANHPLAFGLPIFERPGVLRNAPPTNEILLVSAWNYMAIDAEERAKRHAVDAGLWQAFRPDLFCRMLAKIAHGFAVAELGLDSFKPFLPDVILGKSEFASHYVGGTSEADIRPPKITNPSTELAHELEGRRVLGPGSLPLVSVLIRLFATIEAPTYEIIVGRDERDA